MYNSLNSVDTNKLFTENIILNDNNINNIQLSNNQSFIDDNNKIMSSGLINEYLSSKANISDIPDTSIFVKNNIDQTLTNKFIMNNSNNEFTTNKITLNSKEINAIDDVSGDTTADNKIIYTKKKVDTLINDCVKNNIDQTLTNKFIMNNSNNEFTANKITLNSKEINDIDNVDNDTTADNKTIYTKKKVDTIISGLSGGVGQLYPNSTHGEIFNDYTNNVASGQYSHAGGYNTTASGNYSHAEGFTTKALGNYSHTEGFYTTASGLYSHAEGYITTASGRFSHAEGDYTNADQDYQTAIGKHNTLLNSGALLSVGNGTANNAKSDAFVVKSTGEVIINSTVPDTMPRLTIGTNISNNNNSIVCGQNNRTSADNQLVLGQYCKNDASYYICVGNGTSTAEADRKDVFYVKNDGSVYSDKDVVVNNNLTVNNINYSNDYKNNRILIIDNYFDGNDTTPLTTLNNYYLCISTTSPYTQNYIYKLTSLDPLTTEEIIPEDFLIIYVNNDKRYLIYYNNNWVCINEGRTNIENIKNNSVIFNDYTNNVASGNYSHAEGRNTTASNHTSHAEGYHTRASGSNSHAEGNYTTASGSNSHAEGNDTTASGRYSHAEGYYTIASGNYSHAGGNSTYADQSNQTAIGKYNTLLNGGALLSVGNGTADDARSDAFVVKDTGDAILDRTLNLRYINFNDKDNNRQFGFYVGIIGVYINTGSGYKLYNVEGSAILNESEETATLTTGTIYCQQATDKWQYLKEIVFTYNGYNYVLRPIQIKKNYCGTLCLSSSNWQCTDIYINSLIFETESGYDNWFQKNFAANTYPAYQFCGSRFAIYSKTPI